MNYSNPIVIEFLRAGHVESAQRGAWVLVDTDGKILDSRGEPDQFVFGRSATKGLQALAMVESGAMEKYGLGLDAVALACASHNGEDIHTSTAEKALGKIGLDPSVLLCGPQSQRGSAREVKGTRLGNNCSGKHAGFLALSQILGAETSDYLNPEGAVQTKVVETVREICDLGADEYYLGTDGCSAPTFELPLNKLALGIARIANPEKLSPARAKAAKVITDAAKAHPELVAGTYDRECSRIIEVTEGKIFAKIGAEAVYIAGGVGQNKALAVKIDDGGSRAIGALVVNLLKHYDMIDDKEAAELGDISSLVLKNWDGLEVGSIRLPAI